MVLLLMLVVVAGSSRVSVYVCLCVHRLFMSTFRIIWRPPGHSYRSTSVCSHTYMPLVLYLNGIGLVFASHRCPLCVYTYTPAINGKSATGTKEPSVLYSTYK